VPSSPNCHGTRQRPWRECTERVRRSSRDRFATGLLPKSSRLWVHHRRCDRQRLDLPLALVPWYVSAPLYQGW